MLDYTSCNDIKKSRLRLQGCHYILFLQGYISMHTYYLVFQALLVGLGSYVTLQLCLPVVAIRDLTPSWHWDPPPPPLLQYHMYHYINITDLPWMLIFNVDLLVMRLNARK